MPDFPLGVLMGLSMMLVSAVAIWRPEDVAAMNRWVWPGKILARNDLALSKEWGRVGGILGLIWGLVFLVLCWVG